MCSDRNKSTANINMAVGQNHFSLQKSSIFTNDKVPTSFSPVSNPKTQFLETEILWYCHFAALWQGDKHNEQIASTGLFLGPGVFVDSAEQSGDED